jgi:hypothetical protein
LNKEVEKVQQGVPQAGPITDQERAELDMSRQELRASEESPTLLAAEMVLVGQQLKEAQEAAATCRQELELHAIEKDMESRRSSRRRGKGRGQALGKAGSGDDSDRQVSMDGDLECRIMAFLGGQQSCQFKSVDIVKGIGLHAAKEVNLHCMHFTRMT